MAFNQSPEFAALAPVLERSAVPFCEPLSARDLVVDGHWRDGRVQLTCELGFPWREATQWGARLGQQLEREVAGVNEAVVEVRCRIPEMPPGNQRPAVPGVKNIIAVASGKGGVGKSTTAANLALALAEQGACVGVLDADIYGPSQAQILGVPDRRPEILEGNRMAPIEAVGGVQMVSMGNLVTAQTPMVWRGPMVSGALQQLLNSTQWQDVDYLIVDMPPGTGDIQLTLSQTVPVTGAVIITTPQDLALLDAKKGIEMFRKVQVPVLGVVENMAIHICRQCGHREAIFGEAGGQALASQYQVPLLGQLPLQLSIREQTDSGVPPMCADPDGEVAAAYREIALRMAAELWQDRGRRAAAPDITISDD